MNLTKEDILNASKKANLTELQVDAFWKALEEIELNKPKSNFLKALLYFGAIIAFLSMTWFYTANLENSYSLIISTLYAFIFFASGFYFWTIKKLKAPGGVLSSLGIVMIPLIVYSLQNVMHLWTEPSEHSYSGFYRWISGNWVPMEVCTLTAAFTVLHFIRFPFISALIYFILTFMCMDAIYLFAGPGHFHYYPVASISIGSILTALGVILDKKHQKEFSFWSYLFGMFLCCAGMNTLNIETEWGHFFCFLMSALFIFVSSLCHRKIFIFFGSLGVIFYMGHLAHVFSDSFLFSYILGAIGFSIITLTAFLMRSKKKQQIT